MSASGPTTRDLRRINRSKALRAIYFNGPLSRLQVSKSTELSPATVTNVVGDLLAAGVVVESGSMESEVGRPSVLLSVNPGYGYFVGIDVGETLIQLALFDIELKVVGKGSQSLSLEENQPQNIVDRIVRGVTELLARSGVASNRVIGVGIGVPGVVDPSTGVSVFAPNWGWHEVHLGAMLEKSLGLPMLLDNGAKAMALAESMFGAGKGGSSLAVLLVGTGVGAGIVNEGALYRGASNSAGEWGHTTVEIDGLPCRCGSRGCLEAYIGAPGIIRRYLSHDHRSVTTSQNEQMTMLGSIIDASRGGDATAREVMKDTARYLGVGVANLINLFNPEVIAIGGWAGLLMADIVMPDVMATVERYSLAQSRAKVKLGLCTLGHEAVTQGAAVLVLGSFLDNAGETKRAGATRAG